MNPVPFAQVQATPSKQPLQAVSGVITHVFKQEAGQTQYGPFVVQRVMITEPGTGVQLKVSIFDCDALTPNHINHTLTCTLGQNSKGQWIGLSADHYQKDMNSPVSYGVKASKAGQIFIDGQPFPAGGPQPPPQSAPQYAQTQPPYGQPPPMAPFPPQTFAPPPQQFAPTPPPAYSPPPQTPFQSATATEVTVAPPKSPLAFLAGQTAAYAMCFEAALKVREQIQMQLEQGPGEPLSTEDVRNIASVFYIEGNRKGIFLNVVGNLTEQPHDEP